MQQDFNGKSKDTSGPLALYTAAVECEYDRVKELLDSGYKDLNESSRSVKDTAMHCLANAGETALVAQLIALGADVGARDYTGAQPLHGAAYQGNIEVARMLLAAGADIDAKNNRGRSPLHEAGQGGQADMVRFLVDHGADPLLRDKWGQAPGHVASFHDQYEVSNLLDAYACQRRRKLAAKAQGPGFGG